MLEKNVLAIGYLYQHLIISLTTEREATPLYLLKIVCKIRDNKILGGNLKIFIEQILVFNF